MQFDARKPRQGGNGERGSTVVLAAFASILLLAMAALAIDVVTLYVARTEAQRAADSAALAGATVFVNAGCTNFGTCSNYESEAKAQAKVVGDQNEVFGQLANIVDSDISFPSPSSADANDALIQVTIHRSVPTFFAGALKRFLRGNPSPLPVSAAATAEAFNPSGSPAPVPFAVGCVKPWIMPNVDPNTSNLLVSGGAVVNPSSVIGESALWQSGDASSDYKKIQLSGSSGIGSSYQNDIQSCDSLQLQYGDIVSRLPNGTLGTQQATNNLINGPSPGQDTITGPPFLIMPGANNPLSLNGLVSAGSAVTSSPSVVTVPLYSTCTSSGCTVVGFMQLFINSVNGDTINATILNIAATSGGSSLPTVSVTAGNVLPVRLIRP